MRLSQAGELALLEEIRKRFPLKKKQGRVKVSIGDDAAVLAPSSRTDLLATKDMMAEGVHFDLSLTTPAQLGFKLISVNVSDVYAMGGEPHEVLLGLAVRSDTTVAFLGKFLDGVAEACALYGIQVVGGDLSSCKTMVVSATVLGAVKRPVKRSGASPGDGIYVTATLGDSAAGLLLLGEIKKRVNLRRPPSRPLPGAVMRPLLQRHLMPVARHPRAFVRYATAMIDISDGLFLDLTRLCDESRVGARIYEQRVPVSEQMKKAAAYFGIEPLKLASEGGEDYELLFTAPAGSRIKGAVCIGEITKSGRSLVTMDGKTKKITPRGYSHFKA